MNQIGIQQGISLFNSGHFFDAHEVLEDVWREGSLDERAFLQGLVQAAVAFHHLSTGNRVGALSVLRKAQLNLQRYSAGLYGIELSGFLKTIGAWQKAIEDGSDQPAAPQILQR